MTLDWRLLILLALTALLSGMLSALLTLWAVRRALRRHLLPRLQQQVDRTLSQLGDVVEQRVRKGVVDGIKSLPSPEMARWTREAVTDAASGLIRGGLSSLMGDKSPRKPQP